MHRSRDEVAADLADAEAVLESFDDFGPRRGLMPSYQAALARYRALVDEFDITRGVRRRIALERIRAQLLNGA